MEMGKLTAKLRDAVPVCLLVEGKEIKRYKNIEIPDELKKLEYQDFKFDVPLNGSITFKIMFEPGVLPEEFPQTRERRSRASKGTLEPMVIEAPDPTQPGVSAEAAEEITALIANQSDSVDELPKDYADNEEVASLMEVQAGDEAKPDAITEPATKEAKLDTKVEATSKKSRAKSSKK